jgi:hypothetical protein
MNDPHQVSESSAANEPLEGVSARRKFLRTSGRVAIAAPAVVLLLSAGSKDAAATPGVPYGTQPN